MDELDLIEALGLDPLEITRYQVDLIREAIRVSNGGPDWIYKLGGQRLKPICEKGKANLAMYREAISILN